MGGYKPRKFVLIDLDYAILGVLPEEGTKLGFTVLAKQTKGVVNSLNDQLPHDLPPEARVRADQINGRLRVLRDHGYVVHHTVQPLTDGYGYQRTPKGRRVALEHEGQAAAGETIDLGEEAHAETNPDQ